MARCGWHGGLVERRSPFMDSEEIQQEHLLTPGVGRSESAPSGAAAGSSSVADPTSSLNEDLALALLERRDLAPETLEQLGRDPAVLKSRKVCVAIAAHPRAPRHLALRLLRHFYTADLMHFALRPSVGADLKHFAAEQLVVRLPGVTLGERLTLARRASETVVAALLLDKEPRIANTALENARLTEAAVIKRSYAQTLSQLLLKPCAITLSGRCGARFVWRCCAALTRRWPALWILHATFLRRFCATFCIHRVCRRKSKPTCGRI
jgi:hypothetical protein